MILKNQTMIYKNQTMILSFVAYLAAYGVQCGKESCAEGAGLPCCATRLGHLCFSFRTQFGADLDFFGEKR